MESTLLANRSATRATSYSGYNPASNLTIYSDASQSSSFSDFMNENRAIRPISTALNTMLKTTTETGDIGQFAIKSSRLPPSRKLAGARNEHTVQAPQHSVQSSHGSQAVDDRRRLPSYARDVTSEIVSLYETASQKGSSSSRILEMPDHRSYSMTQASYSSNVLLNHRSYASLRSQPELGIMPRPRSPFLYPARLKRLGFRPSSPILTEGEMVKMGQHVEQEHIPHAVIANARSVPSLKRSISPSTLQLNLTRTFPAQAGQFQPGSRPFPPSVRPLTKSTKASDLHPEPMIFKTSPAFNGSRYASTPVHYHRRSPTSFSTASKSHTPSPLYYDYTEGFNLEGLCDGGVTASGAVSSIPFVGNQSAAELREIANEDPSEYNTPVQSPSNSADCCIPIKSPYGDSLELLDEQAIFNSEYSPAEHSTNITRDIIPLYLDRYPYESNLANFSSFIHSPKSAISAKVADKVLILEDDVGETDDYLEPIHLQVEVGNTNDENTGKKWSNSDRASSLRLSTYLPIFPKPPEQTLCVVTSTKTQARDQQVLSNLSTNNNSFKLVQENAIKAEKKVFIHEYQVAVNDHPEETPRQLQLNSPPLALKCSATIGDRRIRSSRYYSIDHGLSDLAQLISNFESANESSTSQKVCTEPAEDAFQHSVQPLRNLTIVGASKHPPALLGKISSRSNASFESCTLSKKSRSDGDLKTSNSKPIMKDSFAFDQDSVSSGDDRKDVKEDLFVHDISTQQNPNLAVSFSGSPLHAPQALSPTRFLRLKNSVPHLMKALPPVPQNPEFEFSSPKRSSQCEPPSICSPKDFEHSNTSTEIESVHEGRVFIQALPSKQDLEDIPELEQIYRTPQKFRIKSKCFDAQRSPSATSSRPWNLDENYPWHDQQSSIRLSLLRSVLSGNQTGPKFKLRVTRASTSPSGTVRIHPEARSSLELRSPRDLFTSSSSLGGIFRQVGRRFSSKTSITARETTLSAGAQSAFRNNEICDNNPDLLGPPTAPVTACPMSSTEGQSFFSEDSSQVRAHHSLRKRISNLRARLPKPYPSRTISQGNDNGGQREQNVPHAAVHERSSANVNSEREDEYGMPITVLRHKRLRSKIPGWFRDAAVAMRRRVKLCNENEVCCIPYM